MLYVMVKFQPLLARSMSLASLNYVCIRSNSSRTLLGFGVCACVHVCALLMPVAATRACGPISGINLK